jgi:flavin-binding protein dodecin
MFYLEGNLKNAPLAKLVAAEAEWRETVERQIQNLVDEAYFPGSIANSSADSIEDAVDEIIQLAKNVEADAIEWGRVAKACCVKWRAKAAKAKTKTKAKKEDA